jgi:hypothetical protein
MTRLTLAFMTGVYSRAAARGAEALPHHLSQLLNVKMSPLQKANLTDKLNVVALAQLFCQTKASSARAVN